MLAVPTVSMVLLLLLAAPLAGQPAPPAADSARADLPLIRRADAARTRGSGANGVIDTLRPTLQEFADHACPSCRALHVTKADSLSELARMSRANLVIRVSPIPGLFRGWHAAEAAFCAGGLGGAAAFDRVHGWLLERQAQWRHRRDPSPIFVQLAVAAQLDTALFADCLRTGATRPLVMSDARLAGQWAVDGTPTVLVLPASRVGEPLRVVGDITMKRVQRALQDAAENQVDDPPAAYAMVGRWRLDSVALFRWTPDTTAAGQRDYAISEASIAKTIAEIRAGALVIETVFEPTLRYSHSLERGQLRVYSEGGSWTMPGFTSRLSTMTDSGSAGTYHHSRIVERSATRLVMERHFTDGPSRGTAERVFLQLQPSNKPATR
jgi:protein-disulfide isomerase